MTKTKKQNIGTTNLETPFGTIIAHIQTEGNKQNLEIALEKNNGTITTLAKVDSINVITLNTNPQDEIINHALKTFCDYDYDTTTCDEEDYEHLIRILIWDDPNCDTHTKEAVFCRKLATEKLENCPCCEIEPEALLRFDKNNERLYRIACSNPDCGISTAEYKSENGQSGLKKAVAIWNKRPTKSKSKEVSKKTSTDTTTADKELQDKTENEATTEEDKALESNSNIDNTTENNT